MNWAAPKAVDVHNWAASALAGSDAGIPGMMMASETLALTAVELLAEPGHLEQAQIELRKRVGETELEPAQYGGFETFSTDPERFWQAAWE
jgi:aminobenzoyl-glutamate utilization protein B